MERQPDRRTLSRRGKAAPTNLTAVRDPLIGRERELLIGQRLLARDDISLLTLTGAGGSGKTRLALALAQAVRENFDDGVYFVPLAPLRDAGLVVSTIAQVVGLQDFGGQPPDVALRELLATRQMLLVLDNFEHLLEAAPLVGDLLAAAPGLKVLVTSRSPLHLHDEHELPVPPLDLPGPQVLEVDRLASFGAIALFIRRTSAVVPGFALSDDNAAAVVEVCRRLDGLPLAIELAAARTRLFTPAALLRRLDALLPSLADGARDRPARQRTLWATIAWSYDLLNADEQRLLRRLSVFVGGWTLETAEAICGTDGEPGGSVLDGLTSLVEQSLVQRLQAEAEPRFTMLETIGAYALERLQADGELELMQRRHAHHFLTFAELAQPHLWGPDQVAWADRLEADHDNFRAVLSWCRASPDRTDLGLTLGWALHVFWVLRGYFAEGLAWVEPFLEDRVGGSPRARARALYAASLLAVHVGRAFEYTDEALAIFRSIDDVEGIAWSLIYQGRSAQARGRYREAMTVCEEGVRLFRQLGESRGLRLGVGWLGAAAWSCGNVTAAVEHLEESLTLARQVGDLLIITVALDYLGRVALDQGELDRAATLLEENLAVSQRMQYKRGTALALFYSARVAVARGEAGCAAALLREVLQLQRELSNREGIATSLETLAMVAEGAGACARAACLLGAASALRQAIGAPVALADRDRYERCVRSVEGGLDPSTFAAAWQQGQGMTLDGAIAYASQAQATAAAPPARAGRGSALPTAQPSLLSVRELEVVTLIGRGYTNRQIAEALIISERTAETHARNIREKLGFTTRAQIAAWAVRQGLLAIE